MKYTYWHGPDDVDRRQKYAKEFTAEIQANGDDTQRRIQAVYAHYCSRYYSNMAEAPRYSSGWRPRAVNEATSNAAKLSTHLLAQAGDVICDEDGSFAWWCYANQWVLEQHGLWMEHPVATVVRAWSTGGTPWCHLQTVPPRSGLRAYFPDTASVSQWQEFQKHKLAAGATKAEWQAEFA
jgi:hypothetical protein